MAWQDLAADIAEEFALHEHYVEERVTEGLLWRLERKREAWRAQNARKLPHRLRSREAQEHQRALWRERGRRRRERQPEAVRIIQRRYLERHPETAIKRDRRLSREHDAREKAALPPGRLPGRPRTRKIDLDAAKQMRAAGVSLREIGVAFGVTRQAVHDFLKRRAP